LNALLKKNTLAVTEVELFKGILKWADSECARQGLDVNDDKTARRRVLGDSVYEIPFLAMSHENFVKHVSATGILTDTEIVSISQKVCGMEVSGLKWKERKKRQPRLVIFSRFDRTNVSGNIGWVYTAPPDALTIVVNKPVLFHGVRLFGSQGNQYKVKFMIKDKNVTGTYTSEQDKEGVPGYDVMFPSPLPLLANQDYTITATITGPDSYSGGRGKSSVTIDDIVVTFKSIPRGRSPNGTDQTQGQFYKIFLSEM
jgi:hypothetical protein